MEHKKENFGSKIGFILAAAGSAVGLGNIWRFPYLAAKYGGGIFLLIYLVLAITFGFAMMVTELSIGRKTGKSVVGAYKEVNKKFGFLCPLATIVPYIIAPYYCVIGGWVLKYLTVYAVGRGGDAAGDGSFFSEFISKVGSPMLFFVIFATLTAAIVIFGVKKGIETTSKFLMPVLILITIGIAIYTCTLPGALDGLKYYLLPNFEGFTFTMFLKTVVAAMGQLFYSMSIAMGILVTYGSYMRKEDSIEEATRHIETFDTGIAFLAGIIIIPAVFVFSGGDKSALNAGPSLIFITLPNVFESMKGGRIIGTAFFLLVALAALTSAVSLLETMVDIFCEKTKLKRVPGTIIIYIITLVVGSLSVFGYSIWDKVTIIGYQILDFFDFISNNVLMPIVELITCILIGYVVKTKYVEDEVELGGDKFRTKGLFRFMVRYVCPIGLALILIVPFFVSL